MRTKLKLLLYIASVTVLGGRMRWHMFKVRSLCGANDCIFRSRPESDGTLCEPARMITVGNRLVG